jgi:hypothetical protein
MRTVRRDYRFSAALHVYAIILQRRWRDKYYAKRAFGIKVIGTPRPMAQAP